MQRLPCPACLLLHRGRHSGREETPSGGDDVLPLQQREQCCHPRTAGEEQREPHPLAGKHVLSLNETDQLK